MDEVEIDVAKIKPDLPIPISFVGGRYLLFDVNAVTYLRREHGLCGYNIGTLPQSPSQNVFMGLPIIIMPEEAQALVDKELAYVIDDVRAHDEILYARSLTEEAKYVSEARRQAKAIESIRSQEQEEAKRKALSKISAKRRSISKPTGSPSNPDPIGFDDLSENGQQPEEVSLPEPQSNNTPMIGKPPTNHVTPTTSSILLPISPPTISSLRALPRLPPTYSLFSHLHQRGYYLTPGLRFGCQYAAYPGDPLRFHSHFLCVGFGWDEEIDLMSIVAGGRLGTGVKKGFLLGGVEPKSDVHEVVEAEEIEDGSGRGGVRTFSVEWAVM